jgi:excisionase family DNA binding protein
MTTYIPPKFAGRAQLSVDEAAEFLNYSRRTIYRMMDTGEIPYVGQGRLRRVPVADLIAHQERNRQGGEDA